MANFKGEQLAAASGRILIQAVKSGSNKLYPTFGEAYEQHIEAGGIKLEDFKVGFAIGYEVAKAELGDKTMSKTQVSAAEINKVFHSTAKANVLHGIDGNLAAEVIGAINTPDGHKLFTDLRNSGYDPIDFIMGVEVGYNLAKAETHA